MNKSVLIAFALGSIFSSCFNIGKEVEVRKAEKVSVSNNESTAVYNKIQAGTYVAWRGSHLGGIQPRFGKVQVKSAEFLVNKGKLSNAVVEMDMTSLTVENFKDEDSKTKLTGHLQSNDFFKIASFPVSKFELTGISESSGDFDHAVTGNLTILDVTKSISFKANIDVSHDKIVVKSEDFSVDRNNWGLTYNREGTSGVPTDYLIADNIGFTIDVTLTQ